MDPANPTELLGFNVVVGGGMGRTHGKETTFARMADHLGYVAKEDMMELCKAILATQRDHGNRDVRYPPSLRLRLRLRLRCLLRCFHALVVRSNFSSSSPFFCPSLLPSFRGLLNPHHPHSGVN